MKPEMDIVYQDAALLAVNKPVGLLSAPDRYDPDALVVKAVLEADFGQLWPVHRLDKDTSGVLLFARTAEAHAALNTAFEERRVAKTYRAIVRGRPDWSETVCELPLFADGDKQHRTIIDAARGKAALTRFLRIESWRSYSLVEAVPETGRTHQIRVHLAALGFPVACDPLYGDGEPLYLSKIKRRWKGDSYDERPLLARTALHAVSIELPPLTLPGSAVIRIEAPYPKDLRAALNQFAKS